MNPSVSNRFSLTRNHFVSPHVFYSLPPTPHFLSSVRFLSFTLMVYLFFLIVTFILIFFPPNSHTQAAFFRTHTYMIFITPWSWLKRALFSAPPYKKKKSFLESVCSDFLSENLKTHHPLKSALLFFSLDFFFSVLGYFLFWGRSSRRLNPRYIYIPFFGYGLPLVYHFICEFRPARGPKPVEKYRQLRRNP